MQGIKKGVVELADMIAVNKADGDNIKRAKAAAGEYRAALHILNAALAELGAAGHDLLGADRRRRPRALGKSRSTWQQLTATGEFAARRREQQVKWMWAMLEDRFHLRLRTDAKLKARLPAIERSVADGTLSPALAVDEIAAALGV